MISVMRRWLTVVAAGSLLIVAALCVRGSPDAPRQPALDPGVVLAARWMKAATSGNVVAARALVFDPQLGDRSVDGLLGLIEDYNRTLGPPSPWIADEIHPSSGPAMTFVCFSLDYPGYRLDGALVLRAWPDGGLRVWEYRRMEGCVRGAVSITTAPAPQDQ